MILVNSILVYADIIDYYFTDGNDVYHKLKKEKGAKNYRLRKNGKSYTITEENIEELNNLFNTNYIFYKNELYKKLKWQKDKDGYYFIMTDPKGIPKKISQHRLVYFYNNNIIPPENHIVDHIDRDRKNNNVTNLRLVTYKINSNNTDMDLKRLNHSKYIYNCFDVDLNEIACTGVANDMYIYTGIDTKNLNRYAKFGYTYNNKYKFYIIDEMEE